MAKLVARLQGEWGQIILLRLGVNRLGRSQENEFMVEHPTISSKHCEITLSSEGVFLKDCHSTNGTFLNGAAVSEALLQPGQVVRLGDVEFLVEDTEVTVDIPKFDHPTPAPPLVKVDGSVMCRRHEHRLAEYQCKHCHELLCRECVHLLRRRRGKVLLLCPLCSHPCEPLNAGSKKAKRPLLKFLLNTVRLPFSNPSNKEPPPELEAR